MTDDTLYITSIARRRERLENRPRRVVYIPAGVVPENAGSLFLVGLEWRTTLDGDPITVDVWRCRHGHPFREALGDWPCPPPRLPVAPEELQELHRRAEGDWLLREILDGGDDEAIEDLVRHERGDPSSLGWLDSPSDLTRDEAAEAGTLDLQSEHTQCGVRAEHGRWQAYVGLGSHLRIVGTTDTREEAEALAVAHLARSWLERVEEIARARLGDLSWGHPVPVPGVLRDGAVGDPQGVYRAG